MNRLTSKPGLALLILSAIAIFVICAAVGHPIPVSHDALLGLSAMPMLMGDIEVKTVADLGKLIQQMGEGWEEYKKTNDALVKAKAEGKGVADMEAKLVKISEDLSKLSEAKAAMEGTIAAIQKAGLGGGGHEGKSELDREVKSFNSMRRSYLEGKQSREVSADEYIAYKGAFFKAIREGKDMLTSEEVKSLQAGDSGQGGFMLPASTIGRVVAKVYELSPVRQIASVQEISTQALEGMYDNDEASYGWVGETAARTATNTPTVGKWRIEAFEMYAMPEATQTLLDDAGIDVEAWLAGKVANKFARVEGAAFINGTGVGQPRGFTTYTLVATSDATRTWGQIEMTKTGVNGDFAASTPADILFTLIGAFKPAYLQRAQWAYTREVLTKIRKFKESTTNAYIWQPGLAKGQPDTLLGYPMVNMQDLPALTANGASLWLGDWSEAYQIVDRFGIRTLRDPFTNKPFVRFYSTKRVGGGVLNFEALKAIQFST